MGIVIHRQTKVPGNAAARKLDSVFAGAEKLDDAERKVREAKRIRGLRRCQKLLQSLGVGSFVPRSAASATIRSQRLGTRTMRRKDGDAFAAR